MKKFLTAILLCFTPLQAAPPAAGDIVLTQSNGGGPPTQRVIPATAGTLPTGVFQHVGSNVFASAVVPATMGGTGQTSIAASVQALLDSISTTQGTILYNNGTDWVALAPGTSGHFLKTLGAGANPLWAAATAGSGTVTSVAVSGSDGIEIDSGSPITTSGTIALGVNVAALSSHLGLGALATLNAVGSGQITDGAIVNADINASAAIDISKLASSAITIAGTSTLLGGSITASAILDSISSTQGTILYRGASGWAALAPGTAGHFLKTQGAGANPLWAAASGSGSSTLATLTDVNLTSLADVDFLRYDSGTSKWINRTPANARTDLGLGALATLSEVASAQITDGTIVNADINASAAIAYTKMEAGSIFTYSTGGVMTKYSTLAAAKAAATSGQTIFVGPGTYAVTESLLKNGVNWHFAAGASVSRTNAGEGALFDDENSAVTSVISGEGVFSFISSYSGYNAAVWTQHASSDVTIHARSISTTQTITGTGSGIAVWGRNGTLNVTCSESIYAIDQSAGNLGIALYWESGNMHVRAPHIYADNAAVYPHSSASSTGDFFVDADILEVTETGGVDNPAVIFDYGENSSAASWITARIIKSPGAAIGSVVNARESKLYVTAQKLFGRVENLDYGLGYTAALTYVDADKIEAVGNGSSGTASLVNCEYGTMRVTCRHWSSLSYTGETIKQTGGTSYIRGGDFTGGASAKGIEVTGGALTLEGATINTAANSSTNAVTVSGGTVILTDNHFTSHASGKDVAQSGGTVTVSGGYGTGTGGVLTTSGAVGNAIPALINLTSNVTGTLPVANGGTSATTAAGARVSLLPSMTGNTLKVLRVNAGETDYELATVSSGITIGTTTITSGTSGRVLYDNAGVVGELALGTGVSTALGVNVGSAGAFVVNGGALGTPSSGTATNLTGTASGLTAGTVTTNANMTGDVTSSGSNATTIAAMTAPGPLLAENASIRLDPAGSADGKYTGTTVTGTAGATLAFGDVVVLDVTDSRWELADANSAEAADGDARAMLGICVLAAASDGDPTTILLHGIVRADTAFPTLTVGAPVYVGETAGDAVVTQPTTANVLIRMIGHALTGDEMFFNPDNSWMTHL